MAPSQRNVVGLAKAVQIPGLPVVAAGYGR